MGISRTQIVAATIHDKTGYTLTPESYSIRPSSTQRIVLSYSGTSQFVNAAISAVTVTRTRAVYAGFTSSWNPPGADIVEHKNYFSRMGVDSSTQVAISRGNSPVAQDAGEFSYGIEEMY